MSLGSRFRYGAETSCVSWDRLFEFISSLGAQPGLDSLTYVTFIGISTKRFPPAHRSTRWMNSLCALLLDFSGTRNARIRSTRVYAILSSGKNAIAGRSPIVVDYRNRAGRLVFSKSWSTVTKRRGEEMRDVIFPDLVGDSLEFVSRRSPTSGLQSCRARYVPLKPGRREANLRIRNPISAA